ncbi:MAG: hypothetical protein ABIO82_00870, partial [Ginsengibacter sp.]
MKNKSSRKFNVFLCSLFIFLIHLPFVFATSKPHTVAENPSAITAVDEKATSLEKSWLYDSLGLNTLGLSKEAFESGLKGFG